MSNTVPGKNSAQEMNAELQSYTLWTMSPGCQIRELSHEAQVTIREAQREREGQMEKENQESNKRKASH